VTATNVAKLADPTPNPACDLVVDGFEELASKMGC